MFTTLVVVSTAGRPFLRANSSASSNSCPTDFPGAGCNGNCPSCCPVGDVCSCDNCLGCCAEPESDKCVWAAPSGSAYNFSGPHPVGQDYSAPGESVMYTYHYNFCKGTDAYSGKSTACAAYETAVCQQFEQNTFVAVGYLDSVAYSELKDEATGAVTGVEAMYTYGKYTTTVTLLCDAAAVSPVFYPVSTLSSSDNAFNMTVRTNVGCPAGTPPPPPAPTPTPVTCEIKAPSGRNYDLAALQGSTFEANMTSYDTGKPVVYDLFVGVCSAVTECPASSDAASCQINRLAPTTDGPYDQGNLNSMQMVELPSQAANPPVLGVRIEYSDGSSPCYPDDNPRRTVVDLYCNRAASTPIMRWVAEDPVCTLHVAIETTQACPIP